MSSFKFAVGFVFALGAGVIPSNVSGQSSTGAAAAAAASTAATAPQSDTSYIDSSGTAHITR
ncbi:MAG TPA: hypothetical protein VGD64_10710, partial [Acidisarcina sp.]